MSYRLEGQRLGRELRRVADEELEKAVAGLRGGDRVEGVHEARKRRLKRVRALLRAQWGDFHFPVQTSRVTKARADGGAHPPRAGSPAHGLHFPPSFARSSTARAHTT